jgi:hypothetical protein
LAPPPRNSRKTAENTTDWSTSGLTPPLWPPGTEHAAVELADMEPSCASRVHCAYLLRATPSLGLALHAKVLTSCCQLPPTAAHLLQTPVLSCSPQEKSRLRPLPTFRGRAQCGRQRRSGAAHKLERGQHCGVTCSLVTSVQARSTGYKGFLTYHQGKSRSTTARPLVLPYCVSTSRLNSQEC